MSLRSFGIAAAVLLVAACGQAQGGTTPTPRPSTAQLLFAVLEANNTVAIVGLDGRARASATFAPMPVPNVGCMGAIIPPSAHVAAGKVFFADGRGVVRSLGIDNTVTTVATFPMTSTQQMLSFAVSPDGAHIVGTLFSMPSNGACGATGSSAFTFDAFRATSPTTAELVYHTSSTTAPQNVLALTGWDAIGPFGTYPTIWASQGGGPASTLGVLVRVDATTLKPGAQFSDPTQCQVWDSVSSGDFVCQKDMVSSGGTSVAPLSVRHADGTESWAYNFSSANGAFGARVAPDGDHVSICCADTTSGFAYTVVGQGNTRAQLANGFYGEAWLDSRTMVGSYNTNPLAQPPFNLAYVALSSPGVAVPLGFSGSFVGTVRA